MGKGAIKLGIVAIILLTLLTSTFLKVTSSALPLPTINVSNNDSVHRGQAFEVSVSLENNTGFISLALILNYDSEALTLTDVIKKNGLSTLTLTMTNTNTEDGYAVQPFRFLWDGQDPDYSEGELLVLVFESNIEAQLGHHDITLTYDENNTKSNYGIAQEIIINNGYANFLTGAYTVKYLNYDGSLLYEKDYNEDNLPSYQGNTPTRAEDEMYSYIFSKFKAKVSYEENVLIYEATYKSQPIEYQVLLHIDGQLEDGVLCGYGLIPQLPVPEIKKNYTFNGWYLDPSYNNKYVEGKMPSNDLDLYGYYEFNIRADDLPKIKLEIVESNDNLVLIDVNLVANTGIAGLMLTLNYDMEALEFHEFLEYSLFSNVQFSHTKSDNISKEENFRFYWEGVHNNYETGTLLRLSFKIKEEAEAGLHDVKMTYTEGADATYFKTDSILWYTKLDIENTAIGVGLNYNWHDVIISNNVSIDVESRTGMPYDVMLVFTDIFQESSLSNEDITAITNEETSSLLAAYDIKLMKNNMVVLPNGLLTIKLKLTSVQAQYRNLSVYNINDLGEAKYYESRIEDNYIIFETDHLSKWIIVGDFDTSKNNSFNFKASILLISLVTLLSAYVLILIRKKKQN